jgi:hypothetical protein
MQNIVSTDPQIRKRTIRLARCGRRGCGVVTFLAATLKKREALELGFRI